MHTFSVTLKTDSQSVTATDTVTSSITGSLSTSKMVVSAFTPTATGFTAQLSKPFLAADLTLYGAGLNTVQDVTLIQTKDANGNNLNPVVPIIGSLIIDPFTSPSYPIITFNATANGLLGFDGIRFLPDGTYTVTLISGSGSNGFFDTLGNALDGTSTGGRANFTQAFTTHYQANATPILGIPDFARGPDVSGVIRVPNDSAHGIPITLYKASAMTDVTFTLTYNPALLTVAGGSIGDSTDSHSTFRLSGPPTIIDVNHASANFIFHDATAQNGSVVLGDILANVPISAGSYYRAKELLQLNYNTSILINGTVTAVAANGIHVNVYFGDVSGSASGTVTQQYGTIITSLDGTLANNVAGGTDTGFANFTLVDPAVVGDVHLDYSVDSGDVTAIAAYVADLIVPQIPIPPTGITLTISIRY